MGVLSCIPCRATECVVSALVDEYVIGTNPQPVVELHLPSEQIEANVDVERLGQVVINLLSNARKYSSASIYMALSYDETECAITVRDTGIGISPELLPHIFDRFYRVPGVEVQRGSSIGLGLGLYISNQIVESHGGRITVESIPDSGSLFSVHLPYLSVQPTEASAAADDASLPSQPHP